MDRETGSLRERERGKKGAGAYRRVVSASLFSIKLVIKRRRRRGKV